LYAAVPGGRHDQPVEGARHDQAVEGDSPTEGTVEGPLAPQPRPSDPADGTRAKPGEREGGSTRSDGVDDLKRMERNAEEGRD
jgi:hypothetical protein